jgi:hypothetical protein
MYDMMMEPPPPGSPLESVFILVWQMREDAEYYRIRAIVQAAMDIKDDGKAAQDAFKEFADHFFPYLAGEQKRGDKAALQYLMKEIKKGGLAVRPLEPLMKSKMAKKRRKAAQDGTDPDMPIMRKRKGLLSRRRR